MSPHSGGPTITEYTGPSGSRFCSCERSWEQHRRRGLMTAAAQKQTDAAAQTQQKLVTAAGLAQPTATAQKLRTAAAVAQQVVVRQGLEMVAGRDRGC